MVCNRGNSPYKVGAKTGQDAATVCEILKQVIHEVWGYINIRLNAG
jgi:hypothetical protein